MKYTSVILATHDVKFIELVLDMYDIEQLVQH